MSTGDKKSVLIIDDDLTIRKLLGHHLKLNNYLVFEAPGAKDGFQILRNEKINLVLCDVTMEEMDGFTFCREVRKDEHFRALPFVFVTAKTSLEDRSQALESGGDDIITKPFDIQDLLLKIQALIRRSDIYKLYGVKKNLEQSLTKTSSRILLVDDDLSLAKLFQYNLNKSGFECVVAEGAYEGMKALKAQAPDIIVSDIMMPEIDGYEFRRMILADPEYKHIPFIFLTSKGEEDDILDGYDLGIADYVLKTAGPRVVVAKVSAILKSLGKERQKVVSELHSAADSLRVKVVPDNPPVFNGFKISQWHVPYQGIPGGDFIDYFQLNEDNLAVVLGDVMGKKWGAWYFAFAYAGYVRSALRGVLSKAEQFNPSEILQQVNSSVYQDSKISEVFATLSIIMLDKKNNIIRYAGAGDLPVIYKSAEDNKILMLPSKGMLLGFSAEGEYEDITINVKKGDMFFLITDGILESRNEDGDQFGKEGLFKSIENINSSVATLDVVEKTFREFTGSKFEDDISIISIKAE